MAMMMMTMMTTIVSGSGGTCVESGGNWYCRNVQAITYSNFGKEGSYEKVMDMDGCKTVKHEYSGSLAPLDQEVSHPTLPELTANALDLTEPRSPSCSAAQFSSSNSPPTHQQLRSMTTRSSGASGMTIIINITAMHMFISTMHDTPSSTCTTLISRLQSTPTKKSTPTRVSSCPRRRSTSSQRQISTRRSISTRNAKSSSLPGTVTSSPGPRLSETLRSPR